MEEEKKISKIALLIFPLAGIAFLAYFLYARPAEKKEMTALPPLLEKTPSVPAQNNGYPSQIIDLKRWKVTIPVSNEGSDSPIDIKQPELETFQVEPWFMPTKDNRGVIFRAPVNAKTTANSNYPRTELREMSQNGEKEFFWPTTEGTHTLYLTQAITAVPKEKQHVVAGQIHGDDDDLLVVRLEYPKLYLTRGKSHPVTLDENYTLGKKFTVKFVAEGGKISTYYNDAPDPVYVLDKEVKEAYFKAGVYTQSNCETEEMPEFCNSDNYGEVVIYDVKVNHAP